MKLPDGMSETVPTELVLQLVASLQLADHLGDVMSDVDWFLKKAGIKLEDNDTDESPYFDALARLGVTTLYGTTLGEDDAPDKKVEVECPSCGVTLDVYPVKTVRCPCCDCAFDGETGRIVSESEADR